MKSFTETTSIETIPKKAEDALKLALRRLNHLIELEDFPPFKRMDLVLAQEKSNELSISETEVGSKFSEACVDEFWRINDQFNLSDDENVLNELFGTAFESIFKDFESEVYAARKYLYHYRDAKSALIAAEIFANPNLESTWGSPLPQGIYQCSSCDIDYPNFKFDIHSEVRCEECDEPVEFLPRVAINEENPTLCDECGTPVSPCDACNGTGISDDDGTLGWWLEVRECSVCSNWGGHPYETPTWSNPIGCVTKDCPGSRVR